jgi:PadR family transcriptional regulator, regulatory protein PadR
MRFPPEVMKGLTPMLVLQALSLQPLAGLDIVRRIKQRSNEQIDVPEGTVYPVLYRLEKQGAVVGTWEEVAGKRRMRVYSLTANGKKQLQQEKKTWMDLLGSLPPFLGATT